MPNALRLMPYALVLSSCSLIQPPTTIPSYIRVQSCTVTATPSQGTASSNVTDVWVDDNSNYIGIFQIPVSVPILQTGPNTISLQAVVEEDGIASELLPYPFYTTYTKNVNLQPGKLDTINPVFGYTSITNFGWTAGDFESSDNVLKTKAPNTANTLITNIKDSVFGGLRSFEVDLSAGHDTFNALSFFPFTAPASYVVWLEMNYKTDVPMDIGVNMIDPAGALTSPPAEFVSGVNPTSKWKKVYINLGPALQYYNQYQDFYIYFYAQASGNAHIFIDNLKLLYL